MTKNKMQNKATKGCKCKAESTEKNCKCTKSND